MAFEPSSGCQRFPEPESGHRPTSWVTIRNPVQGMSLDFVRHSPAQPRVHLFTEHGDGPVVRWRDVDVRVVPRDLLAQDPLAAHPIEGVVPRRAEQEGSRILLVCKRGALLQLTVVNLKVAGNL